MESAAPSVCTVYVPKVMFCWEERQEEAILHVLIWGDNETAI